MQCPSCGYENVSGAERCASCGRPLPQTVGQGYGMQPSGEPPSMPPSGPYQSPPSAPQQPNYPPQQPGYGTPVPPPPYGAPTPTADYGAPTPQPGYGAPTPQPGYGTPTTPPGYGTTPPGYGPPTPQAGYGPPTTPPGYGQPAQPSYPMQPGYPGQPGYPPAYGTGGQPPQPPQRRNRTGCIVGAIIAVVVVLVACSVGGLVLLNQAGSSLSSTVLSTPTAGPTPTPTKTVIYQNDFSSEATGWPSDTNCSLGSDGYHITDGFICYAPPDNQADIDVTVTVKQVSGTLSNGHGIVVRRTSQGNLYDFDIYADHGWVFFKCVNSDCKQIAEQDTNAAIHTGLNQANIIEVIAKGSHFDFFVNGTKVGQADDSTFSSGLVGLDAGDSTECVFTDFVMAKPL